MKERPGRLIFSLFVLCMVSSTTAERTFRPKTEADKEFFGTDEESEYRTKSTMFEDAHGEYFQQNSAFSNKNRRDTHKGHELSCPIDLEKLKKQHSILREDFLHCKVKLKQTNACQITVYKELITILINRLVTLMQKIQGARFELSLSDKDFRSLGYFLGTELPSTRELQQVTGILKQMLESASIIKNYKRNQHFDEPQTPVFLYGTVIFCVIALLVLLLHFRRQISFFALVFWFFMTAFILSIPWEWYRLYRTQVAKKIADTMSSVPAECFPEKLSVYGSFKLWIKDMFTVRDSDCMKYHQSVMVDPFWEVSPLQAFSAAIANFVVAPLEIAMGGIGKACRALLKELPAQWQVPVFFTIFVIIVVYIISRSDLELALPFVRMGIRRGLAARTVEGNVPNILRHLEQPAPRVTLEAQEAYQRNETNLEGERATRNNERSIVQRTVIRRRQPATSDEADGVVESVGFHSSGQDQSTAWSEPVVPSLHFEQHTKARKGARDYCATCHQDTSIESPETIQGSTTAPISGQASLRVPTEHSDSSLTNFEPGGVNNVLNSQDDTSRHSHTDASLMEKQVSVEEVDDKSSNDNTVT